jgi:hypothetical protein
MLRFGVGEKAKVRFLKAVTSGFVIIMWRTRQLAQRKLPEVPAASLDRSRREGDTGRPDASSVFGITRRSTKFGYQVAHLPLSF